jgi:hypothetical protein
MQKNQQLALLALVAAVALLGVVVVTVAVTIPLQQQAEARGCESGGAGIAFNASRGRCFGH